MGGGFNWQPPNFDMRDAMGLFDSMFGPGGADPFEDGFNDMWNSEFRGFGGGNNRGTIEN